MIVRINLFYIDIIIKSEVWPIYHCLGLVHEIIVFASRVDSISSDPNVIEK